MMVSNDNDNSSIEIQDELESDTSLNAPKLRKYHICLPSVKLFDQQRLDHGARRRRVLDILNARPSMEWFKKLKFSSPLAIFRRTVDEREDISLSVPSPVGIKRGFRIHFIRKINWASLFSICKEWLKNPMNIALLLWLTCVAVALIMQVLLLLGLLNKAFPTTSLRNHWIEIDDQILNALFTLMSLYQHPILFHHLAMLFRWSSEDIIALRKIYCKNGAYRLHEWGHIMVVVVLLHITCLLQYANCGLFWGFTKRTRPELVQNIIFALGNVAPVSAGVYVVYSPLGRDYDYDSDEESQSGAASNAKQLKLYDQRILVGKPEWVGGIFDCSSDITVGYLSFFCTCCVFGWNMERLGFGNMYVHIVTFLLLCVAPFWVFSISAMHIHDYDISDTFGTAGIVLCACGLLYGGFWRIQMRKRFKFPGNTLCFGSTSLTDYFQWMFCWSCSLAQEVRTGNFYDIEEDSLYRKLMDDNRESEHTLNLLSHECESRELDGCSSPLPISSSVSELPNPVVEKEFSAPALVDVMTPPLQLIIQFEDRVGESGSIVTSIMSEGGDTSAPPLSSSLIQTETRVSEESL